MVESRCVRPTVTMASSVSFSLQKEDSYSILNLPILLLNSFGSLQLKFSKNIHRIFYDMLYRFYLLCICALFVLNMVSVYKHFQGRNWAGCFENLSYTMIITDGMFKLIFTQSPWVNIIIKEVKAYEATIRANLEHSGVYNKKVTFHEKMIKLSLFTAVCGLLYLFIRPFFMTVQNADGGAPRRLITTYWHPIDHRTHYTAAYLTELVLMLTTSQAMIFTDVFVCTLVYFCIVQLKFIQLRLIHMSRDSSQLAKEKSIHLHRAQMVITRDIAVHHQKIITMMRDINDALRWYFLLQFFMASGRIALTITDVFFRAMTFMELVAVGLYAIVISVEIVLYYIIGNEVLLESSNGIYNAVAMSDYDELCPAAKRMVVTLLCGAKKPLGLSIGLFDVMSIDTLLKMIKSCYYALSILNNFGATETN